MDNQSDVTVRNVRIAPELLKNVTEQQRHTLEAHGVTLSVMGDDEVDDFIERATSTDSVITVVDEEQTVPILLAEILQVLKELRDDVRNITMQQMPKDGHLAHRPLNRDDSL